MLDNFASLWELVADTVGQRVAIVHGEWRYARLFRLDRIGGGEARVCPRRHLLRGHPERDCAHDVRDAEPFARPTAGSRRTDAVLERPVDLDR